jgi:hypothetical protein
VTLPSRKPQSGSITSALLILLLVLGMLVVSAGTSLFQIRLSNQEAGQDGALALADAAARVLVARIISAQRTSPPTITPNPSTDLDTPNQEIRLTLPTYPGGEGLVTLNPARATALGIPLSVNNIGRDATSPLAGWNGTLVAPQTAHIVSEGRYQGRSTRVEIVLHLPKFPYAVASNVEVTGVGMQVFGVADPSLFDTYGFNIPENLKDPGNVATNATGVSMILGAGTDVRGEAQSRGSVELQGTPAPTVGSIRNQADAAPIPTIDLSDYDPELRPGTTFELLPPGGMPGGTLAGYHKTTGNYTINGPLNLNSGVVYVDGDVTISGGISGSGALIATGTVHVSGGGATMTASEAAIVAGGDLTISGVGAGAGNRQGFRGLLYTEGSLSTSNVDVAGAVAVNNTSGVGSTTVTDSQIIQSQEASVIGIPVGTTVLPSSPIDETLGTIHANLGGGGAWGFPGTPTDYYTANLQLPMFDYDSPPPGFEIIQTEPYIQIAPPASRPADLWASFSLVMRAEHFIDPDFVRPHLGDYADRASAEAALLGIDGGIDAVGYLDDAEDRIWNETVPEFADKFNANVAALAGAPVVAPGTPGAYTVPRPVELDLSRFYNTADQIKILSWRSL